jgi:hypothetical protein
MIGKTVSHYKILEKLGEGGMSSISEHINAWLRKALKETSR